MSDEASGELGELGQLGQFEKLTELVARASSSGRLPDRADLEACRQVGARAAEAGVALAALVDAYLRAVEATWPVLSGVADAPTASDVRRGGQAVWSAVRRSIAALADGYDEAGRHAVRRSEAELRAFVDDLLFGRGDLGRLAERAQRYGLHLAGAHQVIVARCPDGTDRTALARRIDQALAGRFGGPNVLVATKAELVVCVAPGGLRGVPGEFAHQLVLALGTDSGWQIAVGRPHPGPDGIVRSYEEAVNAIELGDRLELRQPVLHAADLLVFSVLLRDRAAMADLVTTVLGPLLDARGGAAPLLETLTVFFETQGNVTATSRRLSISARAVTYRLDRIERLTGYSATDPTQRFTLEAAVLGAKLMDWPGQSLA